MTPEQIFNSKPFQFGLKNIPNFENQVLIAKEAGTPISYEYLSAVRRSVIQEKWDIRNSKRRSTSTAAKATSDVSNKTAETAAITDAIVEPKRMSTRHDEATLKAKNPAHKQANTPDPKRQEHHSATEKLRGKGKKHTTKGTYTTKPKSHAKITSKIPVRSMMNKFKGASTVTKWAIGAAGAITLSYFVRSLDKVNTQLSTVPGTGGGIVWNPKKQYLPAHYMRGYDTIKESLTDFGSRVHLDKTVMKKIAPVPSSTRHSFVTNTSSIMRSNLSLAASNNAIKHTRY